MEEVALVIDEVSILLLKEYFNVCSSAHTFTEDVVLISFPASYNINWMRNKFWSGEYMLEI
jgi:hypothetical protein